MPAKIGHDLHDMTTPNNTQFLLTGRSNTYGQVRELNS